MTADEKNKMYQAEMEYFLKSKELLQKYSKDEIREVVIKYVDNYDQKIGNIFPDEHYQYTNDVLDQFKDLTPKQKEVYVEFMAKKGKNIGGRIG